MPSVRINAKQLEENPFGKAESWNRPSFSSVGNIARTTISSSWSRLDIFQLLCHFCADDFVAFSELTIMDNYLFSEGKSTNFLISFIYILRIKK